MAETMTDSRSNWKVPVAVTLMWATRLLGLAIYVFSVIAAAQISGVLALMLTIFMPPFAQVYWIFYAWGTYGSFINLYTLACLVWAGLLLASMLIVSSRD